MPITPCIVKIDDIHELAEGQSYHIVRRKSASFPLGSAIYFEIDGQIVGEGKYSHGQVLMDYLIIGWHSRDTVIYPPKGEWSWSICDEVWRRADSRKSAIDDALEYHMFERCEPIPTPDDGTVIVEITIGDSCPAAITDFVKFNVSSILGQMDDNIINSTPNHMLTGEDALEKVTIGQRFELHEMLHKSFKTWCNRNNIEVGWWTVSNEVKLKIEVKLKDGSIDSYVELEWL